MKIQQKDNETLAAYVHQFRIAARWCAFDNDTVVTCMFVKGLWDAHITTAKTYVKDLQTLSEVIRIVEKFNAGQQLTAMLTPSTVSMMSYVDRSFVDKQVILAATVLMHSVTSVKNFATLHKTTPTRFLPKECHATKIVLGHDTPIPKGTDHNPPTMGTDMADISAYHDNTTIPTTTGAAAVTEGTHCTSHPATTAAHSPSSHHSSSHYLLTDGCPHCYSYYETPHRHSHNQSQTCHFSHQCHSCHYSMDHSWSSPSSSHCSAWWPQPMKKAKPH